MYNDYYYSQESFSQIRDFCWRATVVRISFTISDVDILLCKSIRPGGISGESG